MAIKNVYEVLEQMEIDIVRLRKEIEALHCVIPLLVEEGDWIEYGLALPASLSQFRRTGT
jgi:regulator of replication initiation timing